MKDSEVLKEAKKMVADNYSFICWAIGDVAGASSDQQRALIAWVMGMLGGVSTYGAWLTDHHPDWSGKYCRDDKTPRLQWLDWMIAYCEAEEAKETS